MIHLGNKIRELRKEKGITQEQLATALNCTAQAVSKWEIGMCYPDVTVLPIIAGYFGISLDALFEYDPEEIEDKIHQILVHARVNAKTFEEKGTTLLEGIANYPGGDILKRELLELYIVQIKEHGRTDLVENALDIGKQLVAECGDSFIYLGAMADMADLYIFMGRYEEGKKMIESMPYRYHLDIVDRMRCTATLLNGDDRLHETREWKRWAHQELYLVCETEGQAFFEVGDYQNALLSFAEAADLLERFGQRELPREYALLQDAHVARGITTVKIAASLFKLGKHQECDAALDKAYHLIRDCFDDAVWSQWEALRMSEFRETYSAMGLDQYKPCEY